MKVTGEGYVVFDSSETFDYDIVLLPIIVQWLKQFKAIDKSGYPSQIVFKGEVLLKHTEASQEQTEQAYNNILDYMIFFLDSENEPDVDVPRKGGGFLGIDTSSWQWEHYKRIQETWEEHRATASLLFGEYLFTLWD